MADAKIARAVRRFLKEVNAEIATGKASEKSFYVAVNNFIEACGDKITAHQEQAGEADKPDFAVDRGKNRVGVVEVKEPGVELEKIEADAAAGKPDHNATQFNRYLAEFDNLLYTNLTEWRRYRHHAAEPVQTAVIATLAADGKLHLNRDGLDDFERLIGAYLAAKPEPQTTAKGLALEMARLTKVLDVNTQNALAADDAYLKSLFDVFQKELIHGLKADEFADMYAQTVAYGLFTARMLPGGEGDFNRRVAGELLPKTNPFLRRVFKSLVDADNMPFSLVWIVDDLAELIEAADTEAIAAELARFGERRRKGEELVEHDPIIYFYEHFLRAYDPKKAKQRGVYYTPLPVVSYIVRSIDELLKSEFDKALGLADQNVVILDPACGTGTFLYEVVRLIHARMDERGPAYWKNEYVPGLLKRLFGFELLMAPYTIAHLKLAEQLRDTGYEFAEGQRLGIYLTNTLEEAEQHVEQKTLPGIMGAISKEKELADNVKAEEPVMVVLGNPPYAGSSANVGKWITDLVKKPYEIRHGNETQSYYEVDGKNLGECNPRYLLDDYVKFLRWAQWRIENTGYGITGMITNHSYIDNPTFRGMRQSLIGTYNTIYTLDLHGSIIKEELSPNGTRDENVFDIRPGVGIFLGVKKKDAGSIVRNAELFGLRKDKYKTLIASDVTCTDWVIINPVTPKYLFVSTPEDSDEYNSQAPVNQIFPINGIGVKTRRDYLLVDFNRAEVIKRIKDIVNTADIDTLKTRYGIKDTKYWTLSEAKASMVEKAIKDLTREYLYRPFDLRYVYYNKSIIERGDARWPIMRHLLRPNLALLTMRRIRTGCYRHFFVSAGLTNKDAVSITDNCYVSPVYLYLNLDLNESGNPAFGREPNLSKEFARDFLSAVGARALENSPEVGLRSGSREVLYPEDIFYYIYGVLHSPTYRTRYAEFLKIDFPRIPLPKDYESFDRLAAAGEKLAALHLLKDKANWDWCGIGQRPGGGTDATVGKVEYDENNQEIIFDARKPPKEQVRVGPVPKHAWEFHVGGYQVLQKWLKDRKGRKVDLGDYVPIIIALAETDRIMKEEIDPVFKEMLGIG